MSFTQEFKLDQLPAAYKCWTIDAYELSIVVICVEKSVIYEQPLNERVRSFLRLEHLFGIAEHHSPQDSQWNSRIAVSCLLEILDLISRSDIKNDLIKELEKHAVTLDALKNNPNVDHQRLNAILNNINEYLDGLRNADFQPGQCLRQDELAVSIKQRISIPGGTCNFDLPAFHHWLHKPMLSRHNDLKIWTRDLSLIEESLAIALFMLRNSTTPIIENAESGFYQQPIEYKLSCQLIRVLLPTQCTCFPEISGGKHRFTIRFMEQPSTSYRPIQTKDTVEFELHCCIL